MTKPDFSLRSALCVFLWLMFAVFLGELAVMFLLSQLPGGMSLTARAFADAVILSTVFFPVAFFLYYRPMAGYLKTIRESESSRSETEARYRELVEGTENLVTQVDEEGRFIFINEAARLVFGTEPEMCIGRSALDFVHPEDRELTRAALKNWLREGIPQTTFENRQVSANGEVRDMLWNVHIQRTADGRVERINSIARDITARKRAEEALEALALEFQPLSGRAFFDAVSRHLATVLHTDYAFIGKQIKGENRVRVVGGYARGEAMEPFEYDLAGTPCENVIGNKICLYPSGVREAFPEDLLLAKMGIEGYIGSPLFDRARKPLGLVVLLHTKAITRTRLSEYLFRVFTSRLAMELEWAEAESQLRQSEARYRNLFSSIRDVILISDPDRTIVDANQPALRNVFGYELEDVVGKNARLLYAEESGYEETGRRVYNAEAPRRDSFLEVSFRKKDGETFTGEIYALKLMAEGQRPIGNIGIVQDVSARKRSEEEKTTLERKLLQAQKMEAVGQLAGGVAHDFNNVLTTVVGYGNLVAMKMATDDPLRAYVEHILDASDRAANLTQSLLAFSRKQMMEIHPVDMNLVVNTVAKFLIRIIGEDIELQTHLAPNDLIVNADQNQMEHVFMNLATNARDAMPEGGRVEIRTQAVEIDEGFIESTGFGRAGSYCEVVFSDSGTGMDAQTLDKVFEPFFTTKEVGKGTGLGLATVYGIVKQHGGFTTVQSVPGEGTSFSLYLPRDGKRELTETTGEPVEAIRTGSETVLLAEDDPNVRMITSEALREFGYRVIATEDGQEALERFAEQPQEIGLLILDVIMPRKNGREALEEIRKIRPEVKALFISGYSGEILEKRGLFDQDVEFLYKPVSVYKLAGKVREMLDRA